MSDKKTSEKRSYLDFTGLSALELRVIGISLGVLSIGIAIAWIGFLYMSSK